MKSKFVKILAVILVCVMSFAFTAAALPADSGESENTVYVMTDAEGKAQKLILTESVIEALPEGKGRGLPVTNADGTEINCGNQDNLMPVKMEISYKLDGKKISPEKLAGKSGHVVMRYDYENLCEVNTASGKSYVPFAVMTGMMLDGEKFSNVSVNSGKVMSDGKNCIVAGLAAPGLKESLNLSKNYIDIPTYVEIEADVKDFSLAMSLTVVTNDLLSDVDVNLGGTTYQIDSAANSLREAMTQLEDGSQKLYDGLNTLYSSSGALVDGVNKLSDGLTQLDANSAALQSGAQQVFNSLLSNANTQIEASLGSNPGLTIDNYNQVLANLIDSLSETNVTNAALQQVTAEVESHNDEIVAAVTAEVQKQVRVKLEAAVTAQVSAAIETAIRGNENGALDMITAAVTEAVRAEVAGKVNAAYRQQVFEGVLKQQNISSDDFENLPEESKANINAAVDGVMNSEKAKTEIAALTEQQMQSPEVQAIIAENVEAQIPIQVNKKLSEDATQQLIAQKTEENLPGAMAGEEAQTAINQNVAAVKQQKISEAMASEAVQSQISAAAQGQASLQTLLQSLNSYSAFYNGIWQYTGGVSAAAAGAGTLKDNMPALTGGITQLLDGAGALNEGVKRFDSEGVSRITNMLQGELGALRDRLKDCKSSAENYQPVAGLGKNAKISFIYRSEAVE